MAKPFYFVIQSWMLEEMHLKLAEAAVYAYIDGLTTSEVLERKGWYGSKRRLATILHTSPSTINDILKRLADAGFIHVYNDHIISTVHREPASKTPDVRNSDTQNTPSEALMTPNDQIVRNPDTFEAHQGSDVPF